MSEANSEPKATVDSTDLVGVGTVVELVGYYRTDKPTDPERFNSWEYGRFEAVITHPISDTYWGAIHADGHEIQVKRDGNLKVGRGLKVPTDEVSHRANNQET